MRATVKAHLPLPDLARGQVADVELTDRVLRRAAAGLVSILDSEQEQAANAGSIDEVMARVGGDPARAREAWDAEHADQVQRVGLLDRLRPLLDEDG